MGDCKKVNALTTMRRAAGNMRRLVARFNFRSFVMSSRVKNCGKSFKMLKGATIMNPRFVTIGDKVTMDVYSQLFVPQSQADKEPELIIGSNVFIGKYNTITCCNKVVIEDYVLLAPHVYITDTNHCFEDINVPIVLQPSESKGTTSVGGGSWLGYGVQVMSGVRIGKHCVIAAGSIVTKDIPDYCVAAGVPAKVIKRYDFQSQEWVTIK